MSSLAIALVVFGVIALVIVALCLAMCVVASRADDTMERWRREEQASEDHLGKVRLP